jgi:hypothetical protein
VAALTLGVGTANATNWGGGQITGSGVGCNRLTHTFAVEAAASQMFSYSAYRNGQYVRYRVYTRDVTYNANSSYVISANWSPWVWVNGLSYGGTFGTFDVPIYRTITIGSTRFWGTAGHSYQALVEYDWWMGKDVTGVDPNAIYTEKSGLFYFDTTRCIL